MKTTPLTDEQIIMKHDPSCRPRARMELEIVNQFLADAKNAGYRLRIDDLEDGKAVPPYGYPSLRDAIFDLDDAYITILDDTGESVGWVYFVFGNDGYDCISDYTTTLETFLAPCLALSDRLANGIDGLVDVDAQTGVHTTQPGCQANGTAPHPRCPDCDYCHKHAPKMAAAAHDELERLADAQAVRCQRAGGQQ